MNVFQIHHHLNPGGVTKIIESQLASIESRIDINPNLICGAKNTSFRNHGAKLFICPEINYLEKSARDIDALKNRYSKIVDFLRSKISKDSILHFHNSSLGKNPLLTYAAYTLAKQGFNAIFQCHDFAEDRPENWSFLERVISSVFGEKDIKKILYPVFKNCRFIVLNSFDQKRLLEYGISKKSINLLPNPIYSMPKIGLEHKKASRKKLCSQLSLNSDKLIVTYPVRVIRRKNIGEFILLCMLFHEKANWLVTLPPINPEEILEYVEWKNFCALNNVPIIFEAGTLCAFEDIISGSDLCVTTSIREGFGMVFIEPCSFLTPVAGRHIPFITDGFISAGIEFHLLYKKLQVPCGNSIKDFPELVLHKKMNLLSELNKNTSLKKKILKLNPFLNHLLDQVDSELVKKNYNTVKENFSIKNYGRKLHEIYKKFS